MKWYESNPIRFEIEKRLLAKAHPGCRLVIKDGRMKLQKTLQLRKNCYQIEGIFSDNYPYSHMRFFVFSPPLKNSPPHRYGDGELCTHGSSDVSSETTAKVYLDWAIQWLQTYERWLDGEPWPETNKE